MAKPKYRGYVEVKGQKINWKEDEVLPLWENEGKSGPNWSGTTKRDIPAGTKIRIYKNKYADEDEAPVNVEPVPVEPDPSDSVPF
jgi:hypothetical protein